MNNRGYNNPGYILAMCVLQSDLYYSLDDKEHAALDELIRVGEHEEMEDAVPEKGEPNPYDFNRWSDYESAKNEYRARFGSEYPMRFNQQKA